jgi:hypothetical protein
MPLQSFFVVADAWTRQSCLVSRRHATIRFPNVTTRWVAGNDTFLYY